MSQPTRIPPRRKSKGDGQFMFSALLIVLVIASLLGMYFYIEEQKNSNIEALAAVGEKIEIIEGICQKKAASGKANIVINVY